MISPVLRNLDSCPWTATKTLPCRWRGSVERAVAAETLQVRNSVFLVLSAQPASVTLHYCPRPFWSLLSDSLKKKRGGGSNLWQGSKLLLIANSLKYHFAGAAGPVC